MKRVDIFSKKYYTDWHDVDEEMRAIAVCDGCWNTWVMSEASGVMCRELYGSPSYRADSVASRCRHQCVEFYNYSDGHDVDEDKVTASLQGGYLREVEHVGITRRNLHDAPTITTGGIASSDIRKLSPIYGLP